MAEAEGKLSPPLYADWVEHLQAVDKAKWQEAKIQMSTDQLLKAGVPALLNVIVDRTPARTMKFSDYSGPVA